MPINKTLPLILCNNRTIILTNLFHSIHKYHIYIPYKVKIIISLHIQHPPQRIPNSMATTGDIIHHNMRSFHILNLSVNNQSNHILYNLVLISIAKIFRFVLLLGQHCLCDILGHLCHDDKIRMWN